MPLFRAFVDRLRMRLSLRRQTLVGPLLDAYWLRGVVRRMAHHQTAHVLAPDVFAPHLRQMSVLGSERQGGVDRQLLQTIEACGFRYVLADLHHATWKTSGITPPFSAIPTDRYYFTLFAWHD